MAIFILVSLIVVITALAVAARRSSAAPESARQGIRGWQACPICIGVAATWLLALIGMAVGFLPTADYQLPTALLMGGSVVGITFQLEKRLLKLRPQAATLLWKTVSIMVGFVTAYGLITAQFAMFALALAVWIVLALIFLRKPKKDQPSASEDFVKKLEKKMEQCC